MNFKINRVIVFCCFFATFHCQVFSQVFKLTGTVRDNREVLQGVKVRQTGKQVSTDADGRFEMEVNPNGELQIFTKGYHSQTIQLSRRKKIDIMLSPDSSYLNSLLARKIKEIEPYSHFLQAEKQAINELTPDYYQARLAFLKDVYFEHSHVQYPDKALTVFLNYCKAKNMLNNHQDRFARAALTLGLELIKDTSPVNMDSIILLSSAYRNIPYTASNGYTQKLDLFLPKNASMKPNDPTLQGDGDHLKFSDRIQVAVGFATPTLTGRQTWPRGNAVILPEWLDKISPYKHVTEDDAPMLFIHGAVDNVVAVDEVLDMHKRYLLNKILSRLEIKAGQGHVLDLDRSMMESACCFFDTVFNQ